jgi:hypothetical protein
MGRVRPRLMRRPRAKTLAPSRVGVKESRIRNGTNETPEGVGPVCRLARRVDEGHDAKAAAIRSFVGVLRESGASERAPPLALEPRRPAVLIRPRVR